MLIFRLVRFVFRRRLLILALAGLRYVKAWPVSIESSITADAPPSVVWRLITDWERQGDWMLEASDFTVIGDQREGIGVEAEATVTIAGISTRDRVKVVGWEPDKRLAIRHLGWVSGTGEIFLTPVRSGDADGTFIFWREELEPPESLGGLGALGMTLLKPIMAKVFQRDLDVLAELARKSA
ncbi:MAG TPA: SRPBCC family protein [Actinomycetota bacterium]|nr:SRPBCC family protein [Actinomycetota bacterium]